MMLDKRTLPAISGFVGLYILYMQPFRVAFFTLLLAAVVLSFTNSFEYTLVVLAFSALIGGFNQFMEGAALRGIGSEGFQSKDCQATRVKFGLTPCLAASALAFSTAGSEKSNASTLKPCRASQTLLRPSPSARASAWPGLKQAAWATKNALGSSPKM